MNDCPKNRLRRIGDILYIALTAAVLTLPLVTVNPRRDLTVDNRRAAAFPALSADGISEFPRNFEQWFGDRFGGRRLFIESGNLLMLKLFHESPSRQILPGREGFIFFASHTGGEAGEDALLKDLFCFTPGEIAREAERFAATADLLDRMPFRTALLTVPTKHLLYFDCMPPRARRFAADPEAPSVRGEAVIEEIFRRRPEQSRKFFIDIFPEALRAAPEIPLYPPENFHWVEGPCTHLASVLAARHFGITRDEWRPEPGNYRNVRIRSDLRHFIHHKMKTPALVTTDDDFRAMGITTETRTEAFLPRLTSRLGAADGVVFYSANPAAPGGRLLLWGDSFTNPLRQDAARYFREVVSVEYTALCRRDQQWADEYTAELIGEFRPEYVIIVNHVDAAASARILAAILKQHPEAAEKSDPAGGAACP